MNQVLETLQALPPDVNRYDYLLNLLSPVAAVPVQFGRNCKAIEGLAIMFVLYDASRMLSTPSDSTVVLCTVALAGKVYRRTIFLVKHVTCTTGKLLAWDTMSLWLLCTLAFSITTIFTTQAAQKSFVDRNPDHLVRFEKLYLMVWLPLWTAGWAVTYGVLTASLVVLNPIYHLPGVPAILYSTTGLVIPIVHWVALPVLIVKMMSSTVDAVSDYRLIEAKLRPLAAAGTGYPNLTGLDLEFAQLALGMVKHVDEQVLWLKRQNATRMVFQVVLLAFLVPASIIYLNALRHQIFTVIPRLRGHLSKRELAASDGEERPKLAQQGKDLKELTTSYALMLVEHIGVTLLILLYTSALICVMVNQREMLTDGSVFNWLFASLFYYAFTILPFVSAFMAVRACRGSSVKRGSKVLIVAHHVRVDTVAETVAWVEETELDPVKGGHATPVYFAGMD